MQKNVLDVLVVGFGRMGNRHSIAYEALECFDLVGICGREHQRENAASAFPEAKFYLDAITAICEAKAQVVCIATHIDSHESLARAAIENGAHVFLEKPVAPTIAETEALFSCAKANGRKIVVGYVRKHDPIWKAFVDRGKQLGSPAVIRFLLDQPSAGAEWQVHQSILGNSSLTFDCAVHYVDMMSKICAAKPVGVTARAVRLHGDSRLHGNYGHLAVEFADGSCGFYDSAWGPMVGSAPAAVVTASGPEGSVSIVREERAASRAIPAENVLICESLMTGDEVGRVTETIRTDPADDTGHRDAFLLQQQYLYDCIAGDACMDEHYDDVLTSMAIVAAGDAAIASGRKVDL